jgi:HSP20 family molecular chaperone IbpA|tara:strand:+ start:8147 stop:8494 length:348 start_codon:yes stop_codon:yes gene_type:complete
MTTLRLRNTLFDNFFGNGLSHVLYEDYDDYNYEETKDSYKYQFNLAGFRKENINVSVENSLLKIKAEQDDRVFSKAYTVPRKADSSASIAKYEDGMLYVTINKKASEKAIELEVN